MKIGGFVPLTLVDYPQRIAATVFTIGCGFRCPFCHNPELVLPERAADATVVDEGEVLDSLEARQGFLDGVVLTGGEPTLQDDLAAFIRRIKALGFLVKLDTNGAQSAVLEALLSEGLLDFIAMDIKAPRDRYAEFAGVPVSMDAIQRSIDAIRASGADYEFRTTVAPGITARDIETMAHWLDGARCYILQMFRTPDEKSLVDPTWSGREALSSEELQGTWDRISGRFGEGGVRS